VRRRPGSRREFRTSDARTVQRAFGRTTDTHDQAKKEAGEEVTTKPLADEISKIREELTELEGHLPDWEQYSESSHGSKKYRSLARRIVLSSQRLEELVKEHTR
jgi:hypothetical protein